MVHTEPVLRLPTRNWMFGQISLLNGCASAAMPPLPNKRAAMTLDEFRNTRPDDLDGPLLSMWWDAHGNWEEAHQIAQDIETPEGAWVHAYLHRKEGNQT